jgi:glyoxylase-like metal-dependent hydrolase (beta-lactamase superfamily II)
VQNYQATVVLGAEGVLVIDPLSGGRAENLLDAIAGLTDLPVVTLLYSHHHSDHIGDAPWLINASSRASAEVEVIATAACAKAIEEHEMDVPAPTRILQAEQGAFRWDGKTVEYGKAPGHCADNTWFLLPEEETLHCVDMVHPGGLEFEGFGLAQDLWFYERTLERLLKLDWKRLVAGHREIGFRDDLENVCVYLRELRRHTSELVESLPPAAFARRDRPAHTWPLARRQAVIDGVVTRMAARWESWPEFVDVAASHASVMYSEVAYFGSGTARQRSAEVV